VPAVASNRFRIVALASHKGNSLANLLILASKTFLTPGYSRFKLLILFDGRFRKPISCSARKQELRTYHLFARAADL
jgi:hypothetical protein